MIKIGCNWSHELLALLTAKHVEIDYIKTGAFGLFEQDYVTMRALRPVLLHGLGHYEIAGMKNVDIVDFERANRLLHECGSPHFGLHLAITNQDMKMGKPMQENMGTSMQEGMGQPMQISMSEEDIPARMASVMRIFKKKLTVPLLLENIPESPQEVALYDYYPYSAPAQISKIIYDNDVGFLLDLTHAKIACMTRGWDVRDYLRALPLERIKEIHVNGVGRDEQGFPDDTHEAMEDEDFELLDFVLSYAKPEIISLEYVGTPRETSEQITEKLRVQLERLRSQV